MKHYNNQLGDEPQLDSKLSAVALNPKKSFILIAVIVAVLIFALYNFLWKTDKNNIEQKPEVSQKIVTEETPKLPNLEVNTAPILPDPPEVTLPDAPAMAEPVIAPVPAPEPVISAPVEIAPVTDIQQNINGPVPIIPNIAPKNSVSSDLHERRKSPIIKMGGGSNNTNKPGQEDKFSNNQADYSPTISSNFNPSKTSFNQQKITRVGEMRYIIAQGKMIDAVLETAVNTEIPAPVRAIITRDIYSEADKNILIPKGSRLIGNFASDSGYGKVRVAVAWNRIIRPDGVDINVDSPSVDRLGKGGSLAEVDAKIADILTSSLVSAVIQIGVGEGTDRLSNKLSPKNSSNAVNTATSTAISAAMIAAAKKDGVTLSPDAIAAGFAAGSQNINNNNQISQITTNGLNSTTVTATPAQLATQNALTNFGSNLQNIQKNFTETKPSLHLNQGTEIKIFVNRDLIFSQNYVYRKRNGE